MKTGLPVLLGTILILSGLVYVILWLPNRRRLGEPPEPSLFKAVVAFTLSRLLLGLALILEPFTWGMSVVIALLAAGAYLGGRFLRRRAQRHHLVLFGRWRPSGR
jgi:hypothetical protein